MVACGVVEVLRWRRRSDGVAKSTYCNEEYDSLHVA